MLMPAELLDVWESAYARPPAEQALCLLSASQPNVPWNDLAALTIGQRDARLLELRQSLWGSQMLALAGCPDCRESLEFGLDVRQLLAAGADVEQPKEMALKVDGYSLALRLPTALDAVAAAAEEDVDASRSLLIDRCVLSAEQDGVDASAEELPDEVVAAVARKIGAADPLTDIQLDLACPACGHHWAAAFDIVSFFWNEIEVWAKRMLRDVHTLAKEYGWAERDILAMRPARRQFYLESVGA